MADLVKNTLNTHRAALGLTQEELAQKCGVSRQTIIAMEKGNYTPSVLLALKLAHACGVRVEDIFTLKK